MQEHLSLPKALPAANTKMARLWLDKPLQPKLTIGAIDDPLERQADKVAERVVGPSEQGSPSAAPSDLALSRKCACGGSSDVTGECDKCKKVREAALQKSATQVNSQSVVPAVVYDVLNSAGEPLHARERAFFEPRFGHDFSRIRIHTDATAAESARSVNALAYTVGHDIAFNTGRYAPQTENGRKLLAHELAHTLQQNGAGVIRREPPDWSPAPAPGAKPASPTPPPPDVFTKLASEIRSTPAYKALDAASKQLTDNIFAEIRKRSQPDQLHFLGKLKLLFDTPVNPPDVIAAHTEAGTTAAVTAEKARLAKPAEAKQKTLEEQASADPKKTWTPIKGKFGGGTYYVDRTSPTNIVVKADILLTPKGSGTKKDVDAVKGMEDAIEKAASNKGYIVDIRFVNTAGADTFKVDVDPSQWETATNWSGGEPLGFAHELHHMFAFDLDRYNYIEAHADNKDMQIPDRLYWFLQELQKPADYNDPTSIMNAAAHPNDDDACRVAGLDVKTCVPARAAARAAGKL